MPKHPRLMKRGATYYHRVKVPVDLREILKREELTQTLKTKCPKEALSRVRAKDAEIEERFTKLRTQARAVERPLTVAAALPSPAPPLSTLVIQTIAERHFTDVYDTDYEWRADLWESVKADPIGFINGGDYIDQPTDGGFLAVCEDLSLEDTFLCCIQHHRGRRIDALAKALAIADLSSHTLVAEMLLAQEGATASRSDLRRLIRRLIEVEHEALNACQKANSTRYEAIIERAAPIATPLQGQPDNAGPKLSERLPKWIAEGRAGGWPLKTVNRKDTELKEFIAIVGDRPIRTYTEADGLTFKETLLALPAKRQFTPFKGLSLVAASKKAEALDADRKTIPRQSPSTINDKIGSVSTFFSWAKAPNPAADLKINTRRLKRKGKRRHPFTTDELNALFSAPLYSGCHSERRWEEIGNVVARTSGKFWVPLVGLFTGLRLGEIIQMRTADVKRDADIDYIDVTTQGDDDTEAAKSLKDDVTSKRCVPLHRTLIDIGFLEFVAQQRAAGHVRVFSDFQLSKDDESWSKTFSKHFTRFRRSRGVNRAGVAFHSFRHCMEDALRNNPDIRNDVRDAIQGHSSNSVSDNYGTGHYLTSLNEALQKIRYPGLNLDHLITPAP